MNSNINTQFITSKNTSVNTTKVPYLFNHLDWEEMKKRWGKIEVFDYGCGRKIDHNLRFFQDRDIAYVGYDPYWGGENLIVKDLDVFRDMIQRYMVKSGCMPVILTSNVLNVINSWEGVMKVKSLVDMYNVPYFHKTYSGKGDGIGRISKQDCWQWNKPTKDYITSNFEVIKKDIITHRLYSCFII